MKKIAYTFKTKTNDYYYLSKKKIFFISNNIKKIDLGFFFINSVYSVLTKNLKK